MHLLRWFRYQCIACVDQLPSLALRLTIVVVLRIILCGSVFSKFELLTREFSNDIDTIYHLAHKFYGACCYCSVPKLKPLLQQLEANSKTQAAHEQKALIKAIDLEIQKILTSLKQYL